MIIGHRRNLAYLERVLKRGTLAHAYLFAGPDSVGKRTLAVAVSRFLLCEEKRASFGEWLGNQKPCECSSCGMAEAKTHPDFIELSAGEPLVGDSSKREVGIKNIHELRRRLAGTSWRGGWKAIVIDQAHELSQEAQSALLKSLEEPRERTVFFLITDRAGALLPTIRSRALSIGFTTVGDVDFAPLLEGVPPREQEELLAIAHQRPGIFVFARDDASFRKGLVASDAKFLGVLEADLPDQFLFAEKVSRDETEERTFFTFLLEWLRTELTGKVRPLKNRVRGRSPAATQLLLKRTGEALLLLEETTANRRLLLDRVFVDLHVYS